MSTPWTSAGTPSDPSVLDRCATPVVLAPLAGGPSTPELCAAVGEAGGLGFLAAGYLSVDELGARIERTRALSAAPFGVNLFVPSAAPADPSAAAAYADRLRPEFDAAGVEPGEPRDDDDDWTAKLALLTTTPVPLVSFTFGCPAPELLASLRAVGTEVWVTVTSPDEAVAAERAGADAVVVQGAEAGGHRGGFTDGSSATGLLALLQLVRARTALPLVGTGAIMTGAALAAVLAAGARAGALGTAFLLCPEAGTSQVHRAALRGDRETALTRAFTGRLARGIRNRFLDEHSAAAPSAYPQVHHLTAPLRAHGRAVGDAEVVNLWALHHFLPRLRLPAIGRPLKFIVSGRCSRCRMCSIFGSCLTPLKTQSEAIVHDRLEYSKFRYPDWQWRHDSFPVCVPHPNEWGCTGCRVRLGHDDGS